MKAKSYKPKPKGNGFNVRLGADLESKLERLARAERVSKGEMLRRLIERAREKV